ncbi:TetR/AcrR family transcriptional regulator [Dyella mobilis]|uniref:TetR/AcrR family transcriptional regulator n=1 Tax=Dyella mobilis TaxID=1849582 RepID=A0ABS2KBP9_9GAMM|nr:TetR/AcrR family transcriptional regulator [Dyella mobilis]MBM7128359.1 TetR/AcrR family transcriptional regulator [Dyella mobilis]GLQ99663.1 TetR family transcriptional regulator [Dyella mobilis]
MTKADSRPAAGRRERKRQETADKLGVVAMGLFEIHGYQEVTMEQIAAAADVAKGTLYNYFPVKEALLAYQFRREIAAGMAAVASELGRKRSFASRMRFLLDASAEWNAARRAYLPHYLRFRLIEIDPDARRAADEDQQSGVNRILEQLLLAGQQQGEVRGDLDAHELAGTFEVMCLGAVMAWLHHPEIDLKQRFALVLDVWLHGIAGKKA